MAVALALLCRMEQDENKGKRQRVVAFSLGQQGMRCGVRVTVPIEPNAFLEASRKQQALQASTHSTAMQIEYDI
jgi:hypothetical protein